MYRIRCKIEGIIEQMNDRFPMPDATGSLPPSAPKGKTAREKILRSKMHMDRKGVFMPADNFRMMLIGSQKRRGAATIYGTEIKKGKATQITSQCEGYISITAPDGGSRIYVKPARKTYDDVDLRSFITSTGGRDYQERPLIKLPWSYEFIILVLDNQMDQSFVRELYDIAGIRCGLGAYGPTFGRFLVTDWVVIMDNKSKKKAEKKK